MNSLLGADAPVPPAKPSPYKRIRIARGGFAERPYGPPRRTTEVSKHIDLALMWLANHQSPAGVWDADGFKAQCWTNTCDGAGHALYDVGVTGLATLAWLDKVTEPEYGRVGYTMRGSGPARSHEMLDKFPADRSEALTAEGIAIRYFCGQDEGTNKFVQKGAGLIGKLPPQWKIGTGDIDMYYWYWGTQALSRVGGEAWRRWSGDMSHVLATAQRLEGNEKGSFDPVGPWGPDGGRIYSTAMMTLIAEILERERLSGRRFSRPKAPRPVK